VRYAGFWIRLVAAALDGMLVWVLWFGLNSAVGVWLARRPLHDYSIILRFRIALNAMQLAVAICYYTLFVGRYGATLGKMAVGLRIRIADGRTVSYGRALCRYFAQPIALPMFVLAFVLPAQITTRGLGVIIWFVILAFFHGIAGFDSEKRTLHDRICNTRVVHKRQ
jgi:uncharacterized RDD family membrane protein YckC